MYRFPNDPRRTPSARTPSSTRAPAAILAFVVSCTMLGSLASEMSLAETAANSVRGNVRGALANQLPATWFAGPSISQLSARFG